MLPARMNLLTKVRKYKRVYLSLETLHFGIKARISATSLGANHIPTEASVVSMKCVPFTDGSVAPTVASALGETSL